MFDPRKPGVRFAARCLIPLMASVALQGCGLFRTGVAGSVVDAHVIYRLVPDCDALVARTLRNGYTVMQPLDVDDETGYGPLPELEVSGIFEGPVREGESVFRYTAPSSSDTWEGEDKQVVANVIAVNLKLWEARSQLDMACGPESSRG